MFQKILLAYDGSPGADRALSMTLELAQVHHAQMTALAVEERLPHLAATVSETVEEKEFADHFYWERLQHAEAEAKKRSLSLACMVRAGHAARTIVEVAEEGGFDLVVLGHSGHSGVWKRFLGTIAEKVSRHVHCHVLLVR